MMGYMPQMGMSSLLKEGTKTASGVDEAVLRNIDACKQLKTILCTSIGPNGMNKMVKSHMGKLFVTSDAATIVRELEIVHPAAKLIVRASEAQEQEAGDATALVIVFAGELLEKAEDLLRMGLHTSDVIEGYERSAKEILNILPKIISYEVKDAKDVAEVTNALKTCISSKLYGLEDTLAPLVAEACISILPANIDTFAVENIRVTKIPGASVSDSSVIRGAVLTSNTEGTIKHVRNAKVAIYTCDFESQQAETKGTVLLTSAQQLMDYNKSEEANLDAKVRSIVDKGVNVIVSTKFGEVASHFLEKYNVMMVKCPSKNEMRRVARTCKGIALPRLIPPTPDEIGMCDSVSVEEIGSTKCTIFRQEQEGSRVATIVVRGSTNNVLEDVERCVDDAVHVYRSLARDPRFCAGAGATEMELARLLDKMGEKAPGLDQYAIRKYAEAMEIIPRVLAQNSGQDPTTVLSRITAGHANNDPYIGVDIEEGGVCNAMDRQIVDHMLTKMWALRLASEAACTVLRVDQIIMAKAAGGPKPRDMMGADDIDEAP
eukprot:Plantae.Rhodophyta-Purpureofilum_apyrenoidigerum.ctg1687.p2 GENE.Plantae.Rhodophyta-Purpureofilum_apyrenoidigerum.ctg1687~~Plantae.Rhodophyta-Purpureofilum_apyrenoidigerum.ctg1687.p2  ORF type:complete len:546 (-),score=124.97 Plantae.Rhodophyta-Purpureofilum_apyrenoidigerum.ctg1687:2384-4021(-)